MKVIVRDTAYDDPLYVMAVLVTAIHDFLAESQ